MPAETFVQIWKCIARPNICVPPALAKPPPRYLQAAESAIGKFSKNLIQADFVMNGKKSDSEIL
jgi:hypothetical protein